MEPTQLTQKQERILEFARTFTAQRGFPPTIREIATRFRMTYRAAYDHLQALERKGLLRRRSPKSRDIEFREFVGRGSASAASEIPIVGRVAGGHPLLAVENVEGTIALPREWTKGGETFLLRVRGDSMRDAHIVPGDLVVVRKQTTAENGEIAVVLVRGEEATLKRFFRRNGRIVLKPENPALEALEFEAREVQVLGVVKGVVRLF